MVEERSGSASTWWCLRGPAGLRPLNCPTGDWYHAVIEDAEEVWYCFRTEALAETAQLV